MTALPPRSFCGLVFGVWLAAVLAAGGATTARAADDRGEGGNPGKALEVIADLTLIDGGCRHLIVSFGVGFRFATEQGLAVTTIMPAGSRRAEFERVLQARQAGFALEDLCGQVARNYAEALPGSIMGLSIRTAGRP